MAFVQPSAPLRAGSSVPADTPRSGVVHVNSRHTTCYTVVGNHLAQHRDLSLVAIGLAVHIQSLPAGSRIGIKFLAARFPESEHRIAAALRELERHGYLARTRERLPGGEVVTRTVSYNQPGTRPDAETPTTPVAVREKPERVEREPLPEPYTPDLDRRRAATELLADLRRHDPRLLLAERDVRRLAPAAAAWLERGAAPDAVRHTLTDALPDDLRHPAALLAHRLTALLPPPLPAGPVDGAALARPDPLQNCEGCDRAFRARTPGRCRGCRPDSVQAA